MKNLRIMTADEEQTQDDCQRGRRVECMPWQRNWHDKYVHNIENMVVVVEISSCG
jgi:hypothetical protein